MALSLATCTASNAPNDTDAETGGRAGLEISATYAFATKSNAAMIAASPNDVASWLGAVAVLGQDGTLSFSDIEANRPNSVSGSYGQVIGFDRPGAPAFFAAVNQNGRWRGFVESSNTYDFTAAAIVGAPDQNGQICAPFGSATSQIQIVEDRRVTTYGAAISEDGVLTLSGGAQTPRLKPIRYCASVPDGSFLAIMENGLSRMDSTGMNSIARTEDSYSAVSFLDDNTVLAVSDNALYALDRTLKNRTRLSIAGGLSIGGIDNVGGVYVTPSPYGGTAFDGGVVFVMDAESPRVVAISRTYFLKQLQLPAPED